MANDKGFYAFKVSKGNKVDFKKSAKEFYEDPEDEIGLIQGRLAGSKNEWYVSIALDRLGLDYRFQMPIGGGRMFRGGYILDFLVYTAPLPTPLEVLGTYWHGGTKDDVTFRFANIARILGSYAREPVEIWENECMSAEQAYETLSRRIG